MLRCLSGKDWKRLRHKPDLPWRLRRWIVSDWTACPVPNGPIAMCNPIEWTELTRSWRWQLRRRIPKRRNWLIRRRWRSTLSPSSTRYATTASSTPFCEENQCLVRSFEWLRDILIRIFWMKSNQKWNKQKPDQLGRLFSTVFFIDG